MSLIETVLANLSLYPKLNKIQRETPSEKLKDVSLLVVNETCDYLPDLLKLISLVNFCHI